MNGQGEKEKERDFAMLGHRNAVQRDLERERGDLNMNENGSLGGHAALRVNFRKPPSHALGSLG